MKSFKYLAVAGLVGSSALVSAPAMAGSLTGNVGVMSQYLFRGIEQGPGAAGYGGLDYGFDSGFYVGTWAATVGFASASGSSSEVDIYAGYAGESAGGLGYDVGVLYYWYPEEDEAGSATPTNNTFEIYGSLGFGPVGLSAYYAPSDYFAASDPDTPDPTDDAGGAYGVYASFSTPMTDKLSFDAAVGYNGGSGNDAFAGPNDDSYMEYNLGVSAALDNGFGMSFALVMTDIEAPGVDDDPKLVVDGSYGFDL